MSPPVVISPTVVRVPACQVFPLLPNTVHTVLSLPTKQNSFGLVLLLHMLPGPPSPFVPYLAPVFPAQNSPQVLVAVATI